MPFLFTPSKYLYFYQLWLSWLGFILLLNLSGQAQPIRFVKPADGRISKDGISWATAYDDTQLQTAINSVSATGGIVYVAAGSYTPTTGTDRSVSFTMKNGVTIYGGFAPTGTPTLAERNPASYSTVLSGDLKGDDGPDFANNGDNSYHVISNSGLNNTAVLDGVTIRGGNANGSDDNSSGGGIFNRSGSPRLLNCYLSGNRASQGGGAIANISGSPSLMNCSLTGNTATNGGAIYNDSDSRPSLLNCILNSNSADQSGGAIVNSGSSPSLVNCSLSSNRAGQGGGAIVNLGSSPSLVNCSLSGNTATVGGAILNGEDSRPSLINCSLSGNTADQAGGAIVNQSSNLTLLNCTLRSNRVTNQFPLGVAIYNMSSSTRLTNCVVWNNGDANTFFNLNGSSITAFNSLFDPLVTGYGNDTTNRVTTTSPFMSASSEALNACSVAIDAGDNSAYTAAVGPSTDLGGNARFYANGRIDMGAYEYQGARSLPVAITQQPPSGSAVSAGGALTVSVSTTGTVSAYQWYKDGKSLGSAQQQASLTISNVQSSDEGNYRLVVIGACNRDSSNVFYLTVNGPPLPIRYVKQGGSGNGSSWANASGDLQAMINAFGVQQVWVAAGTYTPTTGTDRSVSFTMKNGVTIYGGFAPSGTPTLAERNPASYSTVLSGDLKGDDGPDFANNGDNSYHAISNSGLNNTAVLDGVTIRGGNANGSDDNSSGGGIFNRSGSPRLLNCYLSGNRADQAGGAIANMSGSPSLVNCALSGNRAGLGGGAILNLDEGTSLVNCTLSGNTAGQLGGAILNSTIILLTNCVVWNNGGSNTFKGDDVSARYSLFEPSVAGYSTDPTNLTTTTSPFVSPTDLRLANGSVAIDAGDPASSTATSGLTDLAGKPRLVNNIIDIGAYEDQTVAQTIRYVKQGSTGDGSSWANASGDLQAMINASRVQQVWVAAGTYTPTTGTDRSVSFTMKNKVTIYGGFAPSGTPTLAERNPASYSTVLSGDLKGDDGPDFANNGDNSYHVISNSGLNNTAVLDGVTIRGGNANGAYPNERGGAIYNIPTSSPRLVNCLLIANTASLGGAIYNEGDSSPTLLNCTLNGNKASGQFGYGGALFNDLNSVPKLLNCRLEGNRASRGGALYNEYYSQPSLLNCSLTGNTVTDQGGAIYNEGSSPQLTNCSLLDNTAPNGGQVIHSYDSSHPQLFNCIVWNNGGSHIFVNTFNSFVSADYSLIDQSASDYSGTNNLTAIMSPFVSAASVALNACSPAINAGDPTSTTASVGTTDLLSNPRLVGGRVDMGAVEFQGLPISLQAGASLPQANLGVVVSLTAMGASTYQWMAPGGALLTTAATSSTVSASLTTAGVQTFTVVGGDGSCSQTVLVSVTALAGPDLSAILSLPDANFAAGASKQLLMQVQEVNGSPTSGSLVVTITVPTGYSVSFDNTLSSINVSGGSNNPVAVQNSKWQVSNNVANQQLSLSLNGGESVGANGVLSLGFSISRTTANSGSVSNITVNIGDDSSSSYDVNRLNNVYARIISGQ